jgi:hypothetical protein
MNNFDTTPMPTCNAEDDGHRCTREAVMLRPVALCDAHRIEVALATIPDLLRDRLTEAQQQPATPAPRLDLVATARAANATDLMHGVHDSVVYFLANGGRVKIGYTTNLRSRLSSLALRNDSVLLVLHGGPDLERALHAHFAAYRNGNTEWFELAPEVFRYIAMPHPSAASAAAEPIAATAGVPADRVRTVRGWLEAEPELTGAEIGRRLGTSDAFGRRVRRAAQAVTA